MDNNKVNEFILHIANKKLNDFEDNILASKQAINDKYSNSLLQVGNDDPRAKFDKFGLTNDANNWMLWLALYNDSWIFRRAIDKPAADIVNLDININGVNDNLKVDNIKKEVNALKFELMQLLMWGALFGGAVAIMLLDNVELHEMEQELASDKIKNCKKIKLYILDRWNGLGADYKDLVLDVKSADFLKPRYYTVNIGGVNVKVHHSFVLRYNHRIACNLLKNGQLQGWGYPEGVHLLNEIKRDEKLKNSISSLIDKSLIEVIKMKGMRSVFMGAEHGNEKQLTDRLNSVNFSRNYNSLTFLDSEDEYQQNTFNGLGGLSDLMDKNMETIAGALEMSGVLFGDMSGGFSPDNFALVRYDNTIRNRAENYYRPCLQKLLNVLAIKNDVQNLDEFNFEFESMILVKDEDKIDKMTKIVNVVSAMLNDGYINTKQAGEEIMKYAKELGVGESITPESLQKLENSEDLESENVFNNEQNDWIFKKKNK